MTRDPSAATAAPALPSKKRMRRLAAPRLLAILAAEALSHWPAIAIASLPAPAVPPAVPTATPPDDAGTATPPAVPAAPAVKTPRRRSSAKKTVHIDAESLHALRVATRRLRTLLDVFAPWIKPRWRKELKAELRWLGHTMGPARDADVLIEATFPALRNAHPGLNWTALDKHAAQQRDAAHAAAIEGLNSERHATLRASLLSAFGIDDTGKPDVLSARALRRASRAPAGKPRALADQAAVALRERYISLFPECRQLALLDTEQLHALRKRIKWARYTTEFAAPWLRKTVRKPYLEALQNTQHLLGELNDAANAHVASASMPLTQEERELIDRYFEARFVNVTSSAACHLAKLPDAHALERALRRK